MRRKLTSTLRSANPNFKSSPTTKCTWYCFQELWYNHMIKCPKRPRVNTVTFSLCPAQPFTHEDVVCWQVWTLNQTPSQNVMYPNVGSYCWQWRGPWLFDESSLRTKMQRDPPIGCFEFLPLWQMKFAWNFISEPAPITCRHRRSAWSSSICWRIGDRGTRICCSIGRASIFCSGSAAASGCSATGRSLQDSIAHNIAVPATAQSCLERKICRHVFSWEHPDPAHSRHVRLLYEAPSFLQEPRLQEPKRISCGLKLSGLHLEVRTKIKYLSIDLIPVVNEFLILLIGILNIWKLSFILRYLKLY